MFAHKVHVGVLRGGPSSEYDVSLKTGLAVIKNLPSKYQPHDIFIDKNGDWHSGGIARSPERILRKLDAVFNALHGEYGEDGGVQKILEHFKIPFTGSGRLGSAWAMNKLSAKKAFEKAGLQVPKHHIVSHGDITKEDLYELYISLPHKVIVKPVSKGSSVGVTLVHDFSHFISGIDKIFSLGDDVIVEEYITGRESTCGVVEAFRGMSLYPLLPIEIVKPGHKDFFDYEAKYGGETKEICPAPFPLEIKKEIQMMSMRAHETLHLRHYSRSDFIWHPKRGVFILETNSLPGLTEESLIPKSLEAIGCKFSHFLDHLVTIAMGK